MCILHVNPIKLHGEAWSIAFGPPTWTSKAMPVATQSQFARIYLGNAQSAAHLPGLCATFGSVSGTLCQPLPSMTEDGPGQSNAARLRLKETEKKISLFRGISQESNPRLLARSPLNYLLHQGKFPKSYLNFASLARFCTRNTPWV